MMIAQAAFTVSLLVRPSGRAARGLAVLGVMMSCGALAEVGFPQALLNPDRQRTPLLLSGLVLAVAMAVLGFRAARSR